jgi:DNA-binding transcriptional regulator LsrR (DeoR family)
MRTQSKSLSKERKIKITLAHYGAKRTPQAELAAEHDVDASYISKSIAEVLRSGWVVVEKAKESASIERVTKLEQDLLNAFDLETAIVIESGREPEDGDGEGLENYSDDIHEKLGCVFADDAIAHGLLFRDADSIGLGSGRAVYWVCARLYERHISLRPRNITLVSLTGEMLVMDHSGRYAYQMDADLNLSLLRFVFSGPECRLMGYGIGIDSDKQTQVKAKKTLESRSNLTHAILGVGVYAPGHRLWKAGQGVDCPATLKSLKSALSKLIDLSTKYHKAHGRYPVADLSNRLRLLDSVKKKAPKDHDQLAKLVSEVNSRLMTVDEEQLRSIHSIMLVAGTRRKTEAIRSVLTDPHVNIRRLCTDETVANELLRRAD